MRKHVFELRKNSRVQALRGKNAAPCGRTSRRAKNFSLSVIRTADYPHRVVMVEKLQLELLHRGLYKDMTPLNVFSGEFEVTIGHEDEFREVAREFGFNAREVCL